MTSTPDESQDLNLIQLFNLIDGSQESISFNPVEGFQEPISFDPGEGSQETNSFNPGEGLSFPHSSLTPIFISATLHVKVKRVIADSCSFAKTLTGSI